MQMDKDKFIAMSPAERVRVVNKLLQEHDLREISSQIGIPSSSFSKLMREGDYIYHKADKRYYPFVRTEEERITRTKSNDDSGLSFIKQHENTLRKIVEQYENTGLLILDKRIYSNDATFSNKSIRMNNDIYEEFSAFCEKYYAHLKIQHIIAQARLLVIDKEIDRLKQDKINALRAKVRKEIENDEYQLLVDDCNRTISKLNEEKMLIKKTLSKKQSDLNFNELNKKLEDFMKNPTLDRKILHKLIERIEILEDGSPRIYYRFSNPYMSSIFLRATNSTPRGSS